MQLFDEVKKIFTNAVSFEMQRIKLIYGLQNALNNLKPTVHTTALIK